MPMTDRKAIIEPLLHYVKKTGCPSSHTTNRSIEIEYLICTSYIARLGWQYMKYIWEHHSQRMWYYNKNKWVSDHSVEIMWIVFVYGYFTSSQDECNIPTKNNEHDLHIVITHSPVLVFRPYYYWFDIDFNDLCVQL